MKKLLLAIGVIFSLTVTLTAAKQDVPMTIGTKGHPTKNTTVKRTPKYISLAIAYDDISHVIEVRSDEELNAEIFIKSENGDIIGYSSSINTSLNIPSCFKGNLTIYIEGDDWTAIGEINVMD